MDFRADAGGHARFRRPPNYFSAALQMRLLTMVALLMLVLYAMREAREPERWHWLWGHQRIAADAAPNASPSPPEVSATPRALTDEQLASIRDDTVWRPQEQDAWFHLLEQLHHEDPAKLRQRSLGNVGYASVYRQSDVYRGRPVTVRGTAQLAYRVAAPDNSLGLREYCVFWIRPEAGPNLPIAVYALQVPRGFPEIENKDRSGTGTSLQEEVEFTGYFFKRWAYRAQDGISTAPLVLAREPIWFRDVKPVKKLPSAMEIMVWVSAIAGVSILFTVWVFRQTRPRKRCDRS